jgi:hypothetical protein
VYCLFISYNCCHLIHTIFHTIFSVSPLFMSPFIPLRACIYLCVSHGLTGLQHWIKWQCTAELLQINQILETVSWGFDVIIHGCGQKCFVHIQQLQRTSMASTFSIVNQSKQHHKCSNIHWFITYMMLWLTTAAIIRWY